MMEATALRGLKSLPQKTTWAAIYLAGERQLRGFFWPCHSRNLHQLKSLLLAQILWGRIQPQR